MKHFLFGVITSLCVLIHAYAIAYFATLGWKRARGQSVTEVNVKFAEKQPNTREKGR